MKTGRKIQLSSLAVALAFLCGCAGILPPPTLPGSEVPAGEPFVAEVAFVAEAATPEADLEIHAIDVGQGDSTVILCPNGNRILVDVGSKGGKNNSQKAAIREQIRDLLGGRVDVLVVTHPDGDHYNMIARTLDGIPVHRVVIGGDVSRFVVDNFENWLEAFRPSGRLVEPAESFSDPEGTPSSLFDCGEAKVWILAANVPAPGAAENFVNNTPSVVLRIAFGDFSAILTGDATTITENQILERYSPAFLQADILKLGHHGSRATSTGRAWARTVSPKAAFSSASSDNNFGHPSWDVVAIAGDYTEEVTDQHKVRRCAGKKGCERRDTDERIYDTSAAGTIVITTSGTGFDLSCERSSGC